MFAPVRCVACGVKGAVLCEGCRSSQIVLALSRCYRCYCVTKQFQVCPTCRKTVAINHLWVVTMYEGLSKDILQLFKFERLSAAGNTIGKAMVDILPLLPDDTVLCHVPTASSRIRKRGYDQSLLITKELSAIMGFRRSSLIERISGYRQLGSSRQQRFDQASKSYKLKNPSKVIGKKILLVDDVTTSGATMEYVARIMRDAGAESVDGIVFAQAIDG